MASLTPHRDAVARAHAIMLGATAEARHGKGRMACAARMVVAVQAALTGAIADEFDAGTEPGHIMNGCVAALSNAVGGVAGTMTGSLDTREALIFVHMLIGEALDDLPRVVGPDRTSQDMSSAADVSSHEAGRA